GWVSCINKIPPRRPLRESTTCRTKLDRFSDFTPQIFASPTLTVPVRLNAQSHESTCQPTMACVLSCRKRIESQVEFPYGNRKYFCDWYRSSTFRERRICSCCASKESVWKFGWFHE